MLYYIDCRVVISKIQITKRVIDGTGGGEKSYDSIDKDTVNGF